jgi:hypothetical protein
VKLRAANPELIEQQVRAVLQQRSDAEAIALRAEPRWTGGARQVDGRRVVIEACQSPLAVRAALTRWASRQPPQERDLLVVLCDLADADLGADVLARFTPARVLGLDPWRAAAALFGARGLDAAFRKDDGWIADALLTHVPTEVSRPMTGGAVLTVDAALDALAEVLLGAEQLTVDAVLAAAAGTGAFAHLGHADEATRSGLLGALGRRQGALGQLVTAVLATGQGGDLLTIATAARAVYGLGDHDGGKAAGHLESRCGNVAISAGVGAALAQRAEEVLAGLDASDRDRANVVLAEAAALVTRIGAEHPEASDWLPAGFEARIAMAAGLVDTVLDALVAGGGTATADAVTSVIDGLGDAVERVGAHRQRRLPGGAVRHDHLEMAARLTTWLVSPPIGSGGDVDPSFEGAANRYGDDSAWVDRARRRLWHGDADPAIGATYRRVLDAVVDRRREENRRFATRLAAWTTTPSAPTTRMQAGVVAVEDVAVEVLAPLRPATLLFVVLDGCGLASFVELAAQMSEAGYREVARMPGGTAGAGVGRRLTGVAALPTVTEVSRASLIAGRLDRGDQDHERRAFTANAALSTDGRAAAFFHQNRLLGAAGSTLATEVDTALGPHGPRVVGVVINTIDDQLKRGTFGDELRLVDLHALVALLDTARTHGRTVVISADHGHVLAQPDDGGTGTFQGGGTGGERWRVADRPPGDNEVLLRGERVLLGGDAGVLAPWDDDFRYGAKSGGYHGGATPDEVLVPVAVFVPAGVPTPPGWDHTAQAVPLWWDMRLDGARSAVAETAPVPAATGRRKPAKPVDAASVPLFELPPVDDTPVGVAASATTGRVAAPAWLDALLASDMWKLQRGAAGRAPLPDDRVRSVLAAIARRGCVTSFAALAGDADVPMARLSGFLVHLARVLNVDGYAVLEVDATLGEVRLSLPTLTQQFEIVTARS